MKIETKYDIDQEVFIVVNTHLGAFYEVEKRQIKNIKMGGKIWELYDFGSTSRGEKDIFTDLDRAKESAKKKAIRRYERNIEIVDEQNLSLD